MVPMFVYDMSQNGDTLDEPIPTRTTGARLYGQEFSTFTSLVFRAAGRRGDERLCFDQEISDLSDEMEDAYPKIRDMRNALFAHPPFVDEELVADDEVMFWTTFRLMFVRRMEVRSGRLPTPLC
jgi:hypothetical protein